jgi:uncharacterized membrane protein (GlpM family)
MSSALLFWYGLAFKVALTATIVVVASLAVERSGPFVGALIAALPTAAGAAYVILALEHPPAFVAASAIGSVAANACLAMFGLVYAGLAWRGRGLAVSLGAAVVVWLLCALLIRQLEWSIWTAFLLSAVLYGISFGATRNIRAASFVSARVALHRLDIPLRALTVALFVTLVTSHSHQIGSFLSGMFAVFPVANLSFIVILHTRLGGPAAARVVAHTQAPLFGLGIGFLVLNLAMEHVGVWWALLADFATCLAWSAMLYAARPSATKLKERSLKPS